jgi:hypothetical protein
MRAGRGRRLLNVACRTVHLLAFAVLLGGHLWGVEAPRVRPALWLAVGSGLALAALEIAADRRWLVEVRGLLVALKLGLVLLLVPLWEGRVAILLVIAVIASVNAHMPRWFRHAPVLRARGPSGRDRGERTAAPPDGPPPV